MLQILLWISLLLHRTSADITTTNYHNVNKLKCDSLLHRTVYHESNCYFVIDAETAPTDSSKTPNGCSLVIPGAKLIGEIPDTVLTAVFLPKSEFISSNSTGKKKAMCLMDTRLPNVGTDSTTTKIRKCRRANICGEDKQELTYVLPQPFISKLNGQIEPGQTFIFRGRTFSTTISWSLGFHCKRSHFEKGNDHPLYIDFRYRKDEASPYRRVHFSTRHSAFPFHEEERPLPDSLDNKHFEIRIRVHEDRFQMFINGNEFVTYKHRAPLSSITRVSSWGAYSDVQYSYIRLGEKYEPVVVESDITSTGFSFCKTLHITGFVEPSIYRNEINFVRKNGVYINHTRTNDVGMLFTETAFQFHPRFFREKNLMMNDVQNGKWGQAMFAPLPFLVNVHFNLTITNEPRGFVVMVNGKHHTTFAHRNCPNDITSIWFDGFSDMTATVSHAENCELPKESCFKKP